MQEESRKAAVGYDGLQGEKFALCAMFAPRRGNWMGISRKSLHAQNFGLVAHCALGKGGVSALGVTLGWHSTCPFALEYGAPWPCVGLLCGAATGIRKGVQD